MRKDAASAPALWILALQGKKPAKSLAGRVVPAKK
jgi:hypothetical protein